MSSKQFLPFHCFTIIYLLLTILQLEDVTSWLKPFLIPILAFSTLKSHKSSSIKLLQFALFFSWLGDVLLLFVSKNSMFFILGLVAFLVAHIAYIYLFFKLKFSKTPFFNAYLILILGYLFGFLYLLWDYLNEMKIPVIVYALVISMMLYIVIQLHLLTKQKTTQIMVLGAIFFVLSDSILAVNKFYYPIYLSSFWIMSTYLTAQFLLVYGILNLKKQQKKDA